CNTSRSRPMARRARRGGSRRCWTTAGGPDRSGPSADALQALAKALGVLHVALGTLLQPRDLLRRQAAHCARRAADDQRSIREFLALGHQRAGADQAMATDARTVEHDRADADQRIV